MSDRAKIFLTVFIWLTTMGAFVATLAITIDTLGAAVIPIMVFLFGAAIMTNGFIWQWGQQSNNTAVQEQAEKRKRERLDSVLRNMSDDELLSLKRRLAEGDFGDEPIIDDDGELLYRDRHR
jgi:hypothetical protein